MATVEEMRAERETINRQIEALRLKASDLSDMIYKAEADPRKQYKKHASMAFIVKKTGSD